MEEWVEAGVTYREMARRLGVNEDTLKRSLHKNDIVTFEGAKYQTSRRSDVQLWERPCIRCGDTTPRPKNQYICTSCKTETSCEAGLPDGWGF
jgi:IS30 family transposase